MDLFAEREKKASYTYFVWQTRCVRPSGGRFPISLYLLRVLHDIPSVFFELNERILLFKYRIINELEVFFLLSECLAVRGMVCSDQPASFACRSVS